MMITDNRKKTELLFHTSLASVFFAKESKREMIPKVSKKSGNSTWLPPVSSSHLSWMNYILGYWETRIYDYGGFVHPLWKMSKYKGKLQNWKRPVSLTLILCKILDHVIKDLVREHLENKMMTSKIHPGFTKSIS